MSEGKRVISYCIYYGGSAQINDFNAIYETAHGFNRYLLGLSENITLRDKYFPGWEIYLYLEDWLKDDTAVKAIIDGAKDLKVIPFSTKIYEKRHHAAFERYRVLWDTDVKVSIIRDVDQLLTAEDARLVDEWYRWEHMTLTAMGGGFAFKRSSREPIDSMSYDTFVADVKKRGKIVGYYHDGRAFDEECITALSEILGFGPLYSARSREIITTFSEKTQCWRRKSNKRMLIRPNRYMLCKPFVMRRPKRLYPYSSNPSYTKEFILQGAYERYIFDACLERYYKKQYNYVGKVK